MGDDRNARRLRLQIGQAKGLVDAGPQQQGRVRVTGVQRGTGLHPAQVHTGSKGGHQRRHLIARRAVADDVQLPVGRDLLQRLGDQPVTGQLVAVAHHGDRQHRAGLVRQRGQIGARQKRVQVDDPLAVGGIAVQRLTVARGQVQHGVGGICGGFGGGGKAGPRAG